MLKNPRLLLGIFFITILSMMMVPNVIATSWVEIEPEEVNKKATVIVTGTYDFSSKSIPSDFIFAGVVFNVKSVYRGEVSEQIIAGIDMFDVGWAEEFQSEGGEFLLLLEESVDADFLIPVSGPNGMIEIKNGDVVNQNKKSSAFYESILNKQPKKPSQNSHQLESEKKTKSYIPLYVSAVALIIIVGAMLVYRSTRRK